MCKHFRGLKFNVYLDFQKFALLGKFSIHCDERNAEEKSIFTGPFRNYTFTSQYVTTSIGILQSKGETDDFFVHQKDNYGKEYPAWGVNLEVDKTTYKYSGYFVFEGEKYFQTSITIWISIWGITSMYPGGIGMTEDGTNQRKLREDPGSKFMNY